MKWTSVDEKLPESVPQDNIFTPRMDMVIRNKSGRLYLSWYYHGFYLEGPKGAYMMEIESISHWMPLPELPKTFQNCDENCQ